MASQQHHQDRFAAVINAAVDGIVVIDRQGIIQTSNMSLSTLFGYQQKALIGRNISMLMASPHSQNHDHYLKHYIKTGEAKIIGIGREVMALKCDGSQFPIYLTVGEFEGQGESQFVGIIRDLSTEKHKEKELAQAALEIRQLIGRLAKVSRISTMGEMAAGIAHEINQPLAAITSYAQSSRRLLAQGGKHVDQVMEVLDKIARQSLRAGDIIRGMRNWLKQQDTRRIECNCNSLIKEVVNMVQLEAREHNPACQQQRCLQRGTNPQSGSH